jgi:N-methylhydantoinase B
VKIPAVEQLELLYPLRVEHHEVEPDSMGMGQWIGGPGNRVAVRLLSDSEATIITLGDGMANPPHGAVGGTPGIGGGLYVEDDDADARRYISVTGATRMQPRERWIGVSSGGGGFGHPCDRDAELVRRDVRDGIISRGAAKAVFGVVLSSGVDPQVDVMETARARDELRAVPRPTVDPLRPNASSWLSNDMRDGDVYLLNPRLDQSPRAGSTPKPSG